MWIHLEIVGGRVTVCESPDRTVPIKVPNTSKEAYPYAVHTSKGVGSHCANYEECIGVVMHRLLRE